MCVLIVDDNTHAVLALQSLLQGHGFAQILTAGSAEQAFGLLGLTPAGAAGGRSPVGVVLLDIDLPGIDGIEACRRIKATEHLKHVPILMLTGNTDEETLQRAFDVGACDFIAKPFQPAELLARLRSALNLKQEIDRCQAREKELLQVTQKLQRLNEELARLAVLDELTGIANRRFFNMVLEQEWGRAVRTLVPLALILIDVDHFKTYNDHYGHQKGDECLRLIAGRLKGLIQRPGDHLARYGGEEFAIILSHTGPHGAATVAERLCRAIQEMDLEHSLSPTCAKVTISLGAAALIPERSSSADVLLAAADQALYAAKREGRNCYRVFPGLLDSPAFLQGPHAAVAARTVKNSVE